MLQKISSTTDNSIFAPLNRDISALTGFTRRIAAPLYQCRVGPAHDFVIYRHWKKPHRDRDDHPLRGIRRFFCSTVFEDRPGPKLPPMSERDRVDLMYKLADLADAQCANGDPRWEETLAKALALHPPLSAGDPLGLSAMPNYRIGTYPPERKTPKRRLQRGIKGISAHGKRTVRGACELIFEQYPRETLTFGTATLPPLTPEEHDLVCQQIGKLQSWFMEEWGRELERHNLPTDYICVVELQPERWERWGVCAPHLHWVSVGRRKGETWAIPCERGDAIWARVLARVIGRLPDTSCSNRLAMPFGKAHRELSKYLSKSSKLVGEIAEAGLSHQLPRSWWSCSQSLRRQVTANTSTRGPRFTNWLMDRIEDLRADGLVWFTYCFQNFSPNQTTGEVDRRWVGTVGSFTSKSARVGLELTFVVDQLIPLILSHTVKGLECLNKLVAGIDRLYCQTLESEKQNRLQVLAYERKQRGTGKQVTLRVGSN